MIQADMHMHTWFSTDSEACPRDMADEAVSQKRVEKPFALRIILTRMIWNGEKKVSFDVDAYFVEMQKLQEEYAGKLNIRIGIELGLRTYLKDYYEELTKKYPFDFVIGSVHNVPYKKDAEGNILYTDPAAEKAFYRPYRQRGVPSDDGDNAGKCENLRTAFRHLVIWIML